MTYWRDQAELLSYLFPYWEMVTVAVTFLDPVGRSMLETTDLAPSPHLGSWGDLKLRDIYSPSTRGWLDSKGSGSKYFRLFCNHLTWLLQRESGYGPYVNEWVWLVLIKLHLQNRQQSADPCPRPSTSLWRCATH